MTHGPRTVPRASVRMFAAASVIALLAGCAGGEAEPTPDGAGSTETVAGTEAPGGDDDATPAPIRDPWAELPGPVTATSDGADDLATGLDAPWSVARFASGAAVVSERDSGRILEVLPDGTTREVTTVAGVAHGGEGGLLGLAIAERGGGQGADGALLFAMFTADDGNRIVRFDVTSADSGQVAVAEQVDLVTGIPSASNHNGGRLAIGPDGHLYATAGDAGRPELAQDESSLAGKILRIGLDGSVPADNPFGSEVYSMGHRNPQGLAWDRDGRLWASEFGQDTWDELNLIEPGANYGWPLVEGVGDDPAFRDPVLQWTTSEASPSGLTWVGDTLFMASLRGERLWRIDLSGEEAVAEAMFVGDYGRIRDVVVGPEESIWILTNNTDGRGSPGGDDDRLVQLPVVRA
ncbi:PQQ-dependent sugar dehydrogenase [Pseudoclavibacter endophyticus]|uniref:PQQ-dependent sugar dehydrogenase n=2 Tax=Pseudoclavibacter endophyticus TaxID=1778590 RepID=A0A6H9WPG2_9MICO|nr:PQQ-dependent sugar dehydrogenase [Pseudoclavibacter endophyticus]